MEPILLTVYKSPFKKLRIGKENDGGYIICDIPDIHYDIILSGGIGDDITFEEELCSIYPNIHCDCYDGTSYCTLTESTNKNIDIKKKYKYLRG
jgi:hypothetical protein